MKVNYDLPLPAQLGQGLGIISQYYASFVSGLLAPHDLTYPQFTALICIANNGHPCRITDIAEAIEMTQSAVTKVVQKFVGAGMASLTQDTQDRRIKWVTLTPKGFETLTTIQQSFAPAYAQLFEGMTSDDLTGLRDMLVVMGRRIMAMNANPAKENRPEGRFR